MNLFPFQQWPQLVQFILIIKQQKLKSSNIGSQKVAHSSNTDSKYHLKISHTAKFFSEEALLLLILTRLFLDLSMLFV